MVIKDHLGETVDEKAGVVSFKNQNNGIMVRSHLETVEIRIGLKRSEMKWLCSKK